MSLSENVVKDLLSRVQKVEANFVDDGKLRGEMMLTDQSISKILEMLKGIEGRLVTLEYEFDCMPKKYKKDDYGLKQFPHVAKVIDINAEEEATNE